MAYTIVKSDGSVLTTIADGTINTTSTSIGLPGRNYAGYGQTLDTNFVHCLENFASTSPPSNPIRGQLWYDINASTLKVCPTDGETNASAWSTLSTTASGGTTTFGAVTVTGNMAAGNISATGNVTGNAATFAFITVSANSTFANANITSANITTLRTTVITTGAQSTAGTITGLWTANGNGTITYGGPNAAAALGTSWYVTGGNLVINPASNGGIRTDYYYYANGSPISFAGTYSNANVQNYLPNYNGAVGNTTSLCSFYGNILSTGANTTAGSITGNWTLTTGSRLTATYADLAERFESDHPYDAGTVVELGGDKEITAVKFELSEDVFGVVSNSAAYLMNGFAGDDTTHPAVAVGGRVQVKVDGKVKKGQRLVSAGNGIARAAKLGEATAFNIIGRSLQNKTTDGVGTVEAFVKIN